jgi:glycosyltransferase involved in cell wall biosynthesis
LVPYKGFDLTLQAMAQSKELRRDAELLIVGDGPYRASLEAQTRELGLSSIVTFVGWIDHQQLREYLSSAQAFVFPSLREFGGGVVIEAMASGLPSIVVNYGGPGELVTDACGIRVPMGPRKVLVNRLAEAMTTLVGNPDECQRMSLAGVERVRRGFTWCKKAAQIVDIYRDMLGFAHRDSRLHALDREVGKFLCPTAIVESSLCGHREQRPEMSLAGNLE